jgi:hypothetical protein
MSRTTVNKIEFDEPATIGELIEALEDLRAAVGNDAQPRVTGFIELNTNGPRVKAISAERPPA